MHKETAHAIMYVKDAPKLCVQSAEEVCNFVGQYINAQLPDPRLVSTGMGE